MTNTEMWSKDSTTVAGAPMVLISRSSSHAVVAEPVKTSKPAPKPPVVAEAPKAEAKAEAKVEAKEEPKPAAPPHDEKADKTAAHGKKAKKRRHAAK